MAFTKTPQESTYQTKMVSPFKQENHRRALATSDEDYLNCYIEMVNNKEIPDKTYNVVKRAGTTQYIASVGASTVRGFHYNEDFKKLYYVVGRSIYVYNFATSAADTTLTNFFVSSTGDVGFCDYLYDDGTQVVIATDGDELGQIEEDNTITMNADADLPDHIPMPIFLDGYLFVLAENTADIYNSDLNNPLAWTPGNFISAEINPDTGKAIVKLNNYLVTFGSNTVEYFWDAAIATGSPLQRNDTPVKFNGYLGGLATFGNFVFYVGNNNEGQPSVFMLEDFKIQELASPSLIRYLVDNTVTYSSIKGSIISHQGHNFYVLNAGDLTYVLDLETKLWTRWAFAADNNFPMTFAINAKNATTYRPIFVLDGASTVYRMTQNLFQDNGTNFTASGVTDLQYFDTYNSKSMNRFVVWADRPTSSTTISIQWTDDDYQSYSTARTIDLDQDRPNMDRLGRFRRRAFKWSFTADQPLRITGFEVELNLGQG
jgi:hypothetical protein